MPIQGSKVYRKAPVRAGQESKPKVSESAEQQAFIQWARLNEGKWPELKTLFHSPNEGKRSYITGHRMVAEGLKKGIPDLCLPVKRGQYGALFIEMKVGNNKPTEHQQECIDELRRFGNCVVVCYGSLEAEAVTTRYLTLAKPIICCRDCAYYSTVLNGDSSGECVNMMWLISHNKNHVHLVYVKENWFCCHAEERIVRKDV